VERQPGGDTKGGHNRGEWRVTAEVLALPGAPLSLSEHAAGQEGKGGDGWGTAKALLRAEAEAACLSLVRKEKLCSSSLSSDKGVLGRQ